MDIKQQKTNIDKYILESMENNSEKTEVVKVEENKEVDDFHSSIKKIANMKVSELLESVVSYYWKSAKKFFNK